MVATSIRPDALAKSDIAQAARTIAALVFVQMLPATLLAPAVRPFFAAAHRGDISAMHAFMSLNMIGAAIGALVISRTVRARPNRWLAALCIVDALLMVAMAAPVPTHALLVLRTLEGAAHVGASSLLLACAGHLRQEYGYRRAMPMAGAALMIAIAAGSALGAVTVAVDVRAPFVVAAVTLLGVAVAGARTPLAIGRTEAPPEEAAAAPVAPLLLAGGTFRVALGAAFVGRFVIGCIVVSFALFAHGVHHLSDAKVGSLFALLTFPFAFATYPAGRLAERFSRALLLASGGVVLGLALFALGRVPTAALPAVMIVAGIGCAAVFAPTLCYAATAGSAAGRARAMGWVNAAGCLGMLLGPMVSGILAAALKDPSDPGRAPRAAFVLAASSVVVWLALSFRSLVRASVSELAVSARRT
jgi:MFS family permease